VGSLGVQIRKIQAPHQGVEQVFYRHVSEQKVDLAVLTTHQRYGFDRFMRGSISESFSWKTRVKTLLVPGSSKGFVDEQTGVIHLHRLLIPVIVEPQRPVGRRTGAVLDFGCLRSRGPRPHGTHIPRERAGSVVRLCPARRAGHRDPGPPPPSGPLGICRCTGPRSHSHRPSLPLSSPSHPP